jgi:hypothetical protein
MKYDDRIFYVLLLIGDKTTVLHSSAMLRYSQAEPRTVKLGMSLSTERSFHSTHYEDKVGIFIPSSHSHAFEDPNSQDLKTT